MIASAMLAGMANLIQKIRATYERLPSAIKAGWNTGWVIFVGMLLTIATGLLPQLAAAISTGQAETFYESLSVAASAGVSAATAFLIAIVNTLYRWARPIAESYTEIHD